MSELKLAPCPLCGEQSELVAVSQDELGNTKLVYPYCTNVDCILSGEIVKLSKADAIAAWNTRHPDPIIGGAKPLTVGEIKEIMVSCPYEVDKYGVQFRTPSMIAQAIHNALPAEQSAIIGELIQELGNIIQLAFDGLENITDEEKFALEQATALIRRAKGE
jgi:hypothetical protein